MITAVSDVNILIDMDVANLTEKIFKLDMDFTIPDVLFEEEVTQKDKYLSYGLRPVSLSAYGVQLAVKYAQTYRRTSRNDSFALALAKVQQATLLTGDDALRKAAENENIDVHGTIWLVKQMQHKKLLNTDHATHAFDTMKACGRRLPWELTRPIKEKDKFYN